MADPTLPAPGTAGPGWASTLNAAVLDTSRRADIVFNPQFGGYYLDSPRYAGTDDQRLTAAIADQQASGGTTNFAPIILPSRPLSFTVPRTLYSGCKIIGANKSGQKNPDIASGNYAGPEVTLGGSISSGTSSWWNGTGSIYDVYMADFSVQGSQGSSVHQFVDQPSGTLYACEFNALSFNFMRGVFGRSDRKCLMTQVNLSGSWTMNNAWDTQMTVGGSDNVFFMDSFCNIGVASVAAQTGNVNRWFMRLDGIECNVGKVYISTMNGWRGLLINGTSSAINLFDGVYEGYKPTRTNGLIEGPGPGIQVRIDEGTVNMYGCKIGQGMDNPDATEHGLLQITGGEVGLYGVHFYGANMGTGTGTVAAVSHTGGRLFAASIQKRQDESWAGRPRITTTATAGTGTYTYSCPDQSLA